MSLVFSRVALAMGLLGLASLGCGHLGLDDQGLTAGERGAAGAAGVSVGGGSTVEYGKGFRVYSGQSALMILDQNPLEHDLVAREHLEARGLVVSDISQLEFSPGDGDDYDIVVVSHSADGNEMGRKLADCEAPMMVMEPTVIESTGLGRQSLTRGEDSIEIVEPSHLLAWGSSGEITVCSRETTISGTVPTAYATVVARTAGDGDVGVVLAYDAGTPVAGGTLQSPLVAMSLIRAGDCRGPQTWDYFDAAIDWLVPLDDDDDDH